MSGDQPILLTAEADTVLARAVDALGRFPAEQPWVLIGGIAVFIRLGSVTRPTADADTVARSQADLIQRLVDNEATTVISGGDIEMRVGDATIEIDVMDLADEPLPADPERRAFALARRAALSSATTEQIVVTNRDGSVVADAAIPVANAAALIALKTVSMVRRPRSNQPQKVGSDIHDLVRLVASAGARSNAGQLVALDRDLAQWVQAQIARAFGEDLRYTLLRLRNNDRSAAAQSLNDTDIAATVILADELQESLNQERQ